MTSSGLGGCGWGGSRSTASGYRCGGSRQCSGYCVAVLLRRGLEVQGIEGWLSDVHEGGGRSHGVDVSKSLLSVFARAGDGDALGVVPFLMASPR
jgi:hypothetical protein